MTWYMLNAKNFLTRSTVTHLAFVPFIAVTLKSKLYYYRSKTLVQVVKKNNNFYYSGIR